MNEETLYAFPHKFNSAPNETTVCLGMELRDYFAAKAMQGAFTSPIPSSDDERRYIAEKSYKMADEMLKAREQ